MKLLKTLTVAVAAAAAVAFCATSAKAFPTGLTTNYDTVTFSATVMTNHIAGGDYVMKSQKFVTKDLLNILTNSAFAGTNFPTGSKLELGWDGNWNGDLLVVDKTGTNVIYDATYNNGNSSIATVAINPWKQFGAVSSTATIVSGYNNGSFQLIDKNASTSIAGTGPCTDHFTLKNFGTTNTVWSDSQTFNVYGAGGTNAGSFFLTTFTGKIMLKGSGKGLPTYLFYTVYGYLNNP